MTSLALFSVWLRPGTPDDARGFSGEARGDLVAHDLDRFGRGTDEGHPA